MACSEAVSIIVFNRSVAERIKIMVEELISLISDKLIEKGFEVS